METRKRREGGREEGRVRGRRVKDGCKERDRGERRKRKGDEKEEGGGRRKVHVGEVERNKREEIKKRKRRWGKKWMERRDRREENESAVTGRVLRSSKMVRLGLGGWSDLLARMSAEELTTT